MLKLYLYPVVINEDDFDENEYVALIPDLGITIDGKNREETYLYAKDYLRVYIENALINDLDFNLPSPIENIMAKYKESQVMLIDTIIDTKRVHSKN